MLANRSTAAPESPARPAVSWEETACLLCGRDDAAIVGEAADRGSQAHAGLRFAVVQCRRCGLAYTNPRPTPETIGRFYPTDYRPHAPREKRAIRLPSRFWSRVLGRPCPERRGCLSHDGGSRLLDFGCGGGSYLRRMSELGWRVAGVDASPRAVESIREQLGLETHLGSLPHPDLELESFDVITMWQSLEHVHRPLEVLRAAYGLLTPGGKVVISVPNFASLPAKWFGEHWFGLDLPRHLTHFTRSTLSGMLEAAGFRIRSIRGLVHYNWLQVSASRTHETGLAGIARLMLRRKTIARAVAWGCYVFGRADCLVAIAQRPG
jgi:2-polyprenyl-3-methyl-5-hydroxy-6-metoxy-1,4-benzoquinol methylase